MIDTFQRKDEVRAAAFLRRKLPRIRKAAGPYANLCVRALADIRRGLDPDSTDLLALYLATRRILPSDSWALTVLLYHPRNPCR